MADTAGANPFGAPSALSDSPQNPFAAADDNSSTTSLEPLGRAPDDAPSGLALGRASLALDYASDAGAWIPPNPFKFCVVFQIHALRGLPADAERESLVCELHVGAEKLSLPLHPARGTWSATVSRAADLGDNDGEAAASTERPEAATSSLSDRVEIVADARVPEVRLVLRGEGAANCGLCARDYGHLRIGLRPHWRASADAEPTEWHRLNGAGTAAPPPDGAAADDAAPDGTALLLSLRAFAPARLRRVASQRRVFARYADRESGALDGPTFERLMADLHFGGDDDDAFDEPQPPPPQPSADGGGSGQTLWLIARRNRCQGCARRLLGWCGWWRPDCNMFTYLLWYHTLLWTVFRAPDEAHIPVLHRVYFVLMSLGFNLLVVIFFFATDYSLAHLNCGSPNHSECNDAQQALWEGADTMLVCLIDIGCWPALKFAFFFFHDPDHPPPLKRTLEVVALLGACATLFWVTHEAWNHSDDALPVLREFARTWPAARSTEAFKLMALWGLLREYAPPEPLDGIYPPRPDPPRPADPKRVALLSDAAEV